MYKRAVSGVILLIASAQLANAADCVSYNGQTDVFANSCATSVAVAYRTVGGGCFMANAAQFTLAPGATSSQPLLSESCGSGSDWVVDWLACEIVDFENGTCKLNF